MNVRVGIVVALLCLGFAGGALAADKPGTRRIEWERVSISSEAYETAGVLDVNKDGKLDILSGAWWYEAPDWKKHKVCDVAAAGEYYDDFSTIVMDVNSDGYPDIITGAVWGATLLWRENPKGAPVEWKTHSIDKCGAIETTRAWDVDGDGALEICPNTPGDPLRFYKLADGKFTKTMVQESGGAGHGLGFGDVNGDGRGDFIVPNGWWEAPKDSLKDKWTFHQEFEFGRASVPILVADVNGDGVNELIVGQSHDYGLDYYTQKFENGKRVWTKHPIDPYFSQYHELVLADIDGDGAKEIVTGNRYRAHNGNEAGETNIVGLYYFKWNGESFTKVVVDHGTVPGHNGTGIFMSVADINGDGRLDIVVAGKEGLTLFKNLGSESAGAK